MMNTSECAALAAGDSNDVIKLVAAAMAGNPQSFDTLVGRLNARLTTILKNEPRGNTHDLEDIINETWLRVWTHRHEYREQGNFLGWVVTIGRRVALDHWRRARRGHAAIGDMEIVDPSPDPGISALIKEESEQIRACLDQLPTDQRALMMARYYDGMPPAEAMQQLGIKSRGTFDGRFGKAKKNLKTCMSKHAD